MSDTRHLLRCVFDAARAYCEHVKHPTMQVEHLQDTFALRSALFNAVTQTVASLDFHDFFERLEDAVPVRRWRQLSLNHHPDCARIPGERWTTGEADGLTSVQWLKHREIRESADGLHRNLHPTVTSEQHIRSHEGRCGACGATAYGVSLKVELRSGERRMVREYAL